MVKMHSKELQSLFKKLLVLRLMVQSGQTLLKKLMHMLTNMVLTKQLYSIKLIDKSTMRS